MVVAGHVVPLAILMPDHYHTVFSRVEVIIWLVWPPVLILLRSGKMETPAAAELSIALLLTGSAEKCFLVKFINAF